MALALLVVLSVFLETTVFGSHDHVGDHIIDFLPKCPKRHSNATAILTVLADVPVHAVARCHHNTSYVFRQNWNEVTYTLRASFNYSRSEEMCVFEQKDGGPDTYTLVVEIGWGDRGNPVFSFKERYMVTCSYGERGLSVAENQLIHDWYISPRSKQRMMGKKTKKATFDLKIVDLYNQPIKNPLALGRKVRLKAVCTPVKKYIKGFRVVGCTAYSDIDYYDVLRGGCGDGLVFDKKAGFQTKGLVIYSPFFETFKLKGRTVLNFACNFTLCRHDCDAKFNNAHHHHRPKRHKVNAEEYRLCKRTYNCDGDSCKNLQRKRQTDATGKRIPHEEIFTATTWPTPLTEEETRSSVYFEIISATAPISIRFSVLFLLGIVSTTMFASIYMCFWKATPIRRQIDVDVAKLNLVYS